MTGMATLFIMMIIMMAVHSSCPHPDTLPSHLFYANRLSSGIDISAFVIDQYPTLTPDFKSPLTLIQSYPTLDSTRIVMGGQYNIGAMATISNSTIILHTFNYTHASITNTYQFPISNLLQFQCKFIISKIGISSLTYISIDVFAMCTNSTHQATYLFVALNTNYTRVDYGKVTEKKTYNDYILSQKRAQAGYTQVWMIECVYIVNNGNSWVQIFSNQSPDYYWTLNITYDQFKRNNISTLQILDYVYLKGNQPMNGMRVIVQNTYGLIFLTDAEGYKTDRWVLKQQKILRVKALCITSTIAVLTDQHIYILQLSVTKSVQNGYVREVAKTKRSSNKTNVQFITIGRYIVQKYGKQLVAYYLQQNHIKYFKFNITSDTIVIDRQFCNSNAVFIGNNKYVLTQPKILYTNNSVNTVNLQFSDCNKTINIVRSNNNAIEQANKANTLVCVDNKIVIEQPIFVGDGVSMRIEWNGVNYAVPQYTKYQLQLDGSVLNYVHTSDTDVFVLASNGSYYNYYRCGVESCARVHSMQINSLPYLRSELKLFSRKTIGYRNYFADKVVVSAISMGNGYSMSFFSVSPQQVIHLRSSYNTGSMFQWTNIFDLLDYSQQCTIAESSYALNNMYIKMLTGYKFVQNSFSHMDMKMDQYSQQKYDNRWYDDLQNNYQNICSIGSNVLIAYRYQQNGTLRLTSAMNRQPSFYILQHSKLLAQYNNSRVVCLQQSVGVLKNNKVYKINKQLQISAQVIMQSSVQMDKMSEYVLYHRVNNNTVQVYNIESGYRIVTLNVSIQQILVNRYSWMAILNNKTVYNFKYMPPVITSTVVDANDRINVYGTNANASIFRLKYLHITNTLILPNTTHLYANSSILLDNYWNCTVNSIQLIQNNKITPISHFTTIDYSQYDFKFNIATMYLYLHNILIIIGLDVGNAYQQLWIDVRTNQQFIQVLRVPQMYLKGVSNFIGTHLYTLWTNHTFYALNQIYINFTSNNFTNKTIFCNTNTTANLQDLYYIQNRVYADGLRIYKLRYDGVGWNSKYVLDSFWNEQMFRNYLIRNPNSHWKIQIFTFSTACQVEEIDSSTYNLNDRLIDYSQVTIDGVSFIFVLFQRHLIIQKYPLSQKPIKYNLSSSYTRVLVKDNTLYVISVEGDHLVYTTNWSAYPSEQTLKLKQTLARAGTQEIVDAVSINNMLITASSHYLYLYHLTTQQLGYSAQQLQVNKIAPEMNSPMILRLAIVSQSQSQIEVVIAKPNLNRFWGSMMESAYILKVSQTISVGTAQKIRLTNHKYTSDYSILRNAQDTNKVSYKLRTQ